MLAQSCRRWPSITSALGQCIVISGVSGPGMLKRHQHNAAVRKHGTITQCCFNVGPDCGSTLKKALDECHVFHKVCSSDELVLGQRRLTGIEPAMGCDAGPSLNRNLVGRPTSSVRGTS